MEQTCPADLQLTQGVCFARDAEQIWTAYRECSPSATLQQSLAYGKGAYGASARRHVDVVFTCCCMMSLCCRKVEHICEETDAVQHALDKHTRKERRCHRQAFLRSQQKFQSLMKVWHCW